jgi:site-specific DNA-methyltransferase (adenine-specific)
LLGINKVYNEDCIGKNGMCLINNNSIDMILCDLPYGQTSNKWDCQLDLNELWKQYERIIKDNGAIVLTAKGSFMIDLILSNRNLYRYEWIWDKNKGANFAHVRYRPLNVHEYVLIFYKKTPVYNPQMTDGKPYKQKRLQESIKGIADNMGRFTTISEGKRYPKSIIHVEGMAQRHIIHPTQKPVALFEYLINTYTNENDLILDNCMGSFTTAVACINTNRNYIGFENDDKYYNLGQQRINNINT